MTAIVTRGKDISHYQALITKASVRGLGFVAAKCTQNNNFSDPHYATNHSRARSYGVPFWAYHFADPGGASAAAQAKYFLDHAKLKAGDGILLDLEASRLGQADTRAWRNTFLTYCRTRAPGHPIHLYMGSGYCTNGTGKNAAAYADRLWFPHYTVTGWATKWAPGYPSSAKANTGFTPSVWQCSAKPGFDHDVACVTAAQLAGGSTPAPSTGDDDMPEYVSLGITKPYELAAGKWAHLPFDHEYGDSENQHANGAYPGILTTASKFNITVELDGLVGTWQLVMAEKDKTGKWVESRQYAEQTLMSHTLVGSLGKGEHLYLRVNPTANCHVSKANIRCLYWK
ncbi:MAG: GH25 family lysozyme [Actinoallomurus sp.]